MFDMTCASLAIVSEPSVVRGSVIRWDSLLASNGQEVSYTGECMDVAISNNLASITNVDSLQILGDESATFSSVVWSGQTSLNGESKIEGGPFDGTQLN